MIPSWQTGLLIFLRTTSQIVTAGVAITAFALLLYALTFNLRDRVARSVAMVMFCVALVFTTDLLAGTNADALEVEFWLKVQWVGIIFLPVSYWQLSDALLATTGKKSRWRRKWAIRIFYVFSIVLVALLPFDYLVGSIISDNLPAPHLAPGILLDFFLLYYLGVTTLSGYNIFRALRRTTTPTTRRRMLYLFINAIGPVIGVFPYLIFTSNLAAQHSIIFWSAVLLTNLFTGATIIIMSYSVAFFGVNLPDRAVKSRLIKWVLRGPFTASLALGMMTVVRRGGAALADNVYSAWVPLIMVATVLLCEFFITLFFPLLEKYWIYGDNREDLALMRDLENQLLTQNDLRQFLEMVTATVCDKLQASGAFIASMEGGRLEMVVSIGSVSILTSDMTSRDIFNELSKERERPALFRSGSDYIFPLLEGENDKENLYGIIGISGIKRSNLDEDQIQTLYLLGNKASFALRTRRTQQQIFSSLEQMAEEGTMIERVRAAGAFQSSSVLLDEEPVPEENLSIWVKEALSHFWGGPRLTDSPLLKLHIVNLEAEQSHNGNTANALRSVLRQAIEKTRPSGDRKFTGEWILYNILEMKFLEGKKVREIASRLALSEADLYRKQRVAIEAVAHSIIDMEMQMQGEQDDNGKKNQQMPGDKI